MPALMTMTSMVMAPTSTNVPQATASTMAMNMDMGDGCKVSMLLNWNTINACFLAPSFHIRSKFTFFLTCLLSFLLIISLEFLRRYQRKFDQYLITRHASLQQKQKQYVPPEEEGMEEKLLPKDVETRVPGKKKRILLEQLARGMIHMVQFAISYCIMLMFMYSNGYIIISILLGALVGFALFTRDTLKMKLSEKDTQRPSACC